MVNSEINKSFIFGHAFRYIFFFTLIILLIHNPLNSNTNYNSCAIIVLIMGFFYYYYLNYISDTLKQKNNWKSIKCNPLIMVASSIFNPGSDPLDQCLQYKYSHQIDNKIDNLNNVNQQYIEDSKNKINEMLKDTSDDDGEALQALSDNVQDLEDKLNTNQPAIEEVKSDLDNVITTMKSLFGGIKDSDLVNNLKIQND